MATWEEKNPYVGATQTTKKKPQKVVGLLSPQQEEQQAGLLDYPLSYDNTGDGLIGSSQGSNQDYAAYQQAMRALYADYQRQMMAQYDDAQQKKMEEGMAKQAARYAKSEAAYDMGTGTAGNTAATTQGYEGLDHAAYSDQAATFDDAGGAEAVNADSAAGDSGGSYTGAVGGALAGYGAGKKNYYTDPAMRDKKDGFGTHHRDYRAEVGGGTLGGVIGYFSDGYATPLVSSIVDWFHPYAQDMTRSMINAGDSLGGAYGAMVADPIGTWASGKYANSDLVASGLTPLIAPIAGGKAPDIAQKLSEPIHDLGSKIADVFGW